MSEYFLIFVTAVFSSNIVAVSGVGAVSLQSEKKNFSFMLITSFFTILSIVLTGVVYSALEIYVLKSLDMAYLKLFVVTCLACACAFFSRMLVKAMSKEDYFLYEKSYEFPVQVAVTIGSLMVIDLSTSIILSLFTIAMFAVGYILAQIIFYALYERLDNSYALKPARNVPLMLLTLSVVCMICYAVTMCF